MILLTEAVSNIFWSIWFILLLHIYWLGTSVFVLVWSAYKLRCLSIQYIFPNVMLSKLISNCLLLAVFLILINQWLRNGSNGMFEHSQLVGGTWPWAYPALCFSCGYFAYDQWDMLQYRLYSGWIPSILLHHLLLLICFTLALYRNVTINYLILTLICEVCSRVNFLYPFSCSFYLLDECF